MGSRATELRVFSAMVTNLAFKFKEKLLRGFKRSCDSCFKIVLPVVTGDPRQGGQIPAYYSCPHERQGSPNQLPAA